MGVGWLAIDVNYRGELEINWLGEKQLKLQIFSIFLEVTMTSKFSEYSYSTSHCIF